ncbi:MAG: adenylyltransferase/cytidyltransferase family protein [Verrucomicrobia bacterium]|nr:adenylyltransferase/cytidyltransferase family protein [Verrucomicrobiota bacterium]
MNLPNPKLLSLSEAAARRQEWRATGRKVVLTNGVFDLLHTGHLHSLQSARAQGDVLVVAINSDASVRAIKGPTRPVQGERERAFALGALWCVDAVVVFGEPRLTAEIRTLRPDVYCKAGDYTIATLNPEERAALEDVGAKIVFVPFLPGFSTTGLIAKIKAAGQI